MGTMFDVQPDGMRRSEALAPLRLFIYFIILSSFQAIGCATMTKPPPDAISSAELTLRTAVEARADEFAPMDLQRAREKLERSRKAMAMGKHEEARRLAETAQVEGELAKAKADAEITRLAADALRQRSDALRQEIERRVRYGSSTANP